MFPDGFGGHSLNGFEDIELFSKEGTLKAAGPEYINTLTTTTRRRRK